MKKWRGINRPQVDASICKQLVCITVPHKKKMVATILPRCVRRRREEAASPSRAERDENTGGHARSPGETQPWKALNGAERGLHKAITGSVASQRKSRKSAWTIGTLNVRRKSSTTELSLAAEPHKLDIMVVTELGGAPELKGGGKGTDILTCFTSAAHDDGP
jgi:hypothetical protein